MTTYIIRRLVFCLVTLLGISIITYVLVYAGPVDPTRVLAGPRAQGASIETLRKTLGLDQPFYVQYLKYMGQLLRGNMGMSWYFNRPVVEALFARFPSTGMLAVLIICTEMVIGIPLGALAALKAHSILDRGVLMGGLVLMSMPSFFFGLLLIYFLAFRLQLLPIGGSGGLRHMVLPVITVALPGSVWYAIMLRSNMLDVASADYVRTARAKGVPEKWVLLRHMLRNAILPVLTMAGMDFAALLTGIVIIETLFNYPGIGWQAAQAAGHMDVPMIMGSVLFASALIAVANLVVDVLYAVVDPRVRLG